MSEVVEREMWGAIMGLGLGVVEVVLGFVPSLILVAFAACTVSAICVMLIFFSVCSPIVRGWFVGVIAI